MVVLGVVVATADFRREGGELVTARAYVASQTRKLVEFEKKYVESFPLNIVVSEADAATLTRLCPGARSSRSRALPVTSSRSEVWATSSSREPALWR